MPRYPRNVVKRGESFYFRIKAGGHVTMRSLGRNLQEAKRRAILLRQDFLAGKEVVLEGAETVASFGETWLKDYVAQRRNAKGQEMARVRLESHVNPILGSMVLQEVRSPHIRALRADLEAKEFRKDRKLSIQSVRHVLADVRCLFRYAVEAGELELSPFRSSIMPKLPEILPMRLSDEEVDAILLAATEAESFTIRLALYTGLRWGELHRLQWRHVVAQPVPHLALDRTKSGKVRRVPLSPDAAELLKEERERTSSLFVLPLRIKNFGPYTARIREKAKVAWHFHMLRHTFACRWLESGGSKEALQKILGHSTIRLTERYGQLSDEAVFREMERISAGRGNNRGYSPVKDEAQNVKASL